MILGGAPASSKTTNLFSLERITNSIGMIIFAGGTTASICEGVTIGASIASLAATALSVFTAVFRKPSFLLAKSFFRSHQTS